MVIFILSQSLETINLCHKIDSNNSNNIPSWAILLAMLNRIKGTDFMCIKCLCHENPQKQFLPFIKG